LLCSCGEDQWYQDSQNAGSRSPSQCDLRTLLKECAARMPEPSADLSGEAAPTSPQYVRLVFQSVTTASRDCSTGSWPKRISQILSSYRRQGDRTAGHRWAVP